MTVEQLDEKIKALTEQKKEKLKQEKARKLKADSLEKARKRKFESRVKYILGGLALQDKSFVAELLKKDIRDCDRKVLNEYLK